MGKVVSQEEVLRERPEWESSGKRVVFILGCFDLLHPGHIRLLEQARAHGDIVTVGVLADETVGRIAAASNPSVERPVTPALERAEVLAALAAVEYVAKIDGRGLSDFLRRFRPDAVIDGAEPSSAASPLTAAAKAAGIEVTRIPLEPGHSSSRLIERIAQLHA